MCHVTCCHRRGSACAKCLLDMRLAYTLFNYICVCSAQHAPVIDVQSLLTCLSWQKVAEGDDWMAVTCTSKLLIQLFQGTVIQAVHVLCNAILCQAGRPSAGMEVCHHLYTLPTSASIQHPSLASVAVRPVLQAVLELGSSQWTCSFHSVSSLHKARADTSSCSRAALLAQYEG